MACAASCRLEGFVRYSLEQLAVHFSVYHFESFKCTLLILKCLKMATVLE